MGGLISLCAKLQLSEFGEEINLIEKEMADMASRRLRKSGPDYRPRIHLAFLASF